MILGPDGQPLTPSTGAQKSLDIAELFLLDSSEGRTPRSARRIARESYGAVPYTFRAINEVTGALTQVPVQLVRRVDGGDEPVEAHPLLDLLKRPNAMQSWRTLRENLIAFKKLTGSAYLLVLRQGGDGRPIPGGMFCLRSDRVTVVMSEDGIRMPEQFVYRPDEGDPQVFTPDQVLMLRTFNPLDDVYGLSEVLPAAGSVDALNESQTWNNNLLRNGGKPSAAVIAKHRLAPEQRAQLEDWTARQYGGAQNAGRIAVLEGTEIDWRELGMNARDLDYIAGREMSAIEVALAHGVPPELLGVGQKTFSNYAEARKALYTNTVRPELEYLLDELNAWLLPMYPEENLRLVAQYGVVEELAQDAQAEYRRISEAFSSGWLTVNDARREAEMPEVDAEQDLFAYEQQALARGAGGLEPPETAGAEERLEVKEAPTADWARKEYGGRIERFRAQLTGEVSAILARTFQRQQKAATGVLRDAGGFTPVMVEELTAALDDQGLRDDMRDLFVSTTLGLIRVGDQNVKADPELLGPLFTLLRRDRGATRVDLEQVEQGARDFVTEVLSRDLARIQKTTQRNVLKAIRRSLERGDSLLEIAAQMDDVFAQQAGRIPMIAQTESVGISNGAVDQLAQALGTAPTRMWVSQDDGRVRPSHVAADGQRIPQLGKFQLQGGEARFPGDPLLPPSERINCRCFVLHLDEGEG